MCAGGREWHLCGETQVNLCFPNSPESIGGFVNSPNPFWMVAIASLSIWNQISKNEASLFSCCLCDIVCAVAI